MLVKIFYDDNYGVLPNIISTVKIPNIIGEEKRDELHAILDLAENHKCDIIMLNVNNFLQEKNPYLLTCKMIFCSDCDLYIGTSLPKIFHITYKDNILLQTRESIQAIRMLIKTYLSAKIFLQ
jgi:hypothetical protein